MAILIFLLLVIAFVGSIGIFYIIFYNRLMTYRSKIEQAESIIDECLRNKYDSIVKIDSLISANLKHEKSFFADLNTIKDDNITNFDFDRKLVSYMAIVEQLKQDYDSVNEDREIKKILSDIKAVDEKLKAAKVFYNKYTNKSNEMVRSFPSNIVAKLHNMNIKPFFDGKDMQDDIVDDFKI